MLLVNTYLGMSKIEGIGVFARHAIPAGTLIFKLDTRFDRLVPRDVYDALTGEPKNYLERYSYPYKKDETLLVFEADDGKYMNHSERPNCEFPNGDDGFALADIAAGEELTCDYRLFFGDALEMLGERNAQIGKGA